MLIRWLVTIGVITLVLLLYEWLHDFNAHEFTFSAFVVALITTGTLWGGMRFLNVSDEPTFGEWLWGFLFCCLCLGGWGHVSTGVAEAFFNVPHFLVMIVSGFVWTFVAPRIECHLWAM